MKDDLCSLVPKLPEETNLQYAVFLLYCESDSLKELWRKVSVQVSQDGDKMSTVFGHFQATPAKRTLERWSSKFHWRKRKDKQTSYIVEVLSQEFRERHTEESQTFARALFDVVRKIEPPEDRRKYNRFPKPFIRKKKTKADIPPMLPYGYDDENK